MSDQAKQRFQQGAEGADIVGLKPGQKFDPVKKMRDDHRYYQRLAAIARGEQVPPLNEEDDEDGDAESDPTVPPSPALPE